MWRACVQLFLARSEDRSGPGPAELWAAGRHALLRPCGAEPPGPAWSLWRPGPLTWCHLQCGKCCDVGTPCVPAGPGEFLLSCESVPPGRVPATASCQSQRAVGRGGQAPSPAACAPAFLGSSAASAWLPGSLPWVGLVGRRVVLLLPSRGSPAAGHWTRACGSRLACPSLSVRYK